MKNVQKLLFLVLLYQLMPFLLAAQPLVATKSLTPDKPHIFTRLPSKFECSLTNLKKLFAAELGQKVSLPFHGSTVFNGTVTAKLQTEPGVVKLNVMSSNFPGAMLNMSLIIQPDKSEQIIGRIINPKNGDVLLISEENKRYYFIKDLKTFVMADCPLPDEKLK
jgi:hypothetical protein